LAQGDVIKARCKAVQLISGHSSRVASRPAMTRSVRELKAELTARGIDFSSCREKYELEALLAEAPNAVHESIDESEMDGGYAMESSGCRRAWVEFVTDGEALCHWDDGSSGIVQAAALTPIPEGELPGPTAFNGSFEDARAAAFTEGRLLVCAVRGARGTAAEKAERMHSLALASDDVSALVGENAVFWQGDCSALREPHQHLLAPQGPPALAMVLPLAVDAMKVLSTSSEGMTKEATFEAFVNALEGLESHRDMAQARLISDEAQLRQAQDEEFAAALALDRAMEESRVAAAPAAAAAAGDDKNTAHVDESAEVSTADETTEDTSAAEIEGRMKRRRLLADEFLAASPPENSKLARLVLRLPTGERVERSFGAGEPLERVFAWAECCQFLPEAKDRELDIPRSFVLATSFPQRRLCQEDRSRSLAELGLSPSAALLLLNDSA